MNLYFECKSGISGDMSVGALLDLGASRENLDRALKSINLENEFEYKITEQPVNSIKTTDFDVVIKGEASHCHEHHHEAGGHCHHHEHGGGHIHRNLDDVNKIIDKADTTDSAKELAKKIFKIVAEAEAKVHNKDISEVHFHEVGAIDSIADILSFAVLYEDLNPEKVYFSSLTEGQGTVECCHGVLPVPVPAVCEIVSKYGLPVKISDNDGEMITPTGAAIAAALYTGEKLPDEIIIEKVGYGRGKRPYKNPVLRVMKLK